MKYFRRRSLYCAVVLVLTHLLNAADDRTRKGQPDSLAILPPMGWNSWDAYGTTINEADFKGNADWLAQHLKAYGWRYLVVDADWFVTNPVPEGNSKEFQYVMDGYGRYQPAVRRFPTAGSGAGSGPLADYVHSLGLKFGIHILRGIPK